ncbi:hypothetical protein Q2T76_00265 [Lactobacillus sp. YT155]|uniref:hypothetical protein n=1 Tax=Lactobacillus sp. YT155 TaxID=3060955 RepID=UPI00265D782C|nr:hypothetical protein [Lactobacillus sp. YT155]MDO1604481.1 hypothetical protein [Lactobacillus sp. YT155]
MTQKFKKVAILFVCLMSFLPYLQGNKIQAAGNDARIDGQYPMGVASDYMLVAGNRIRNIGGNLISGRVMTNSMALDSSGFNSGSIWNNSLNTYDSGISLDVANDFYSQLWNPAVIINDFTKESTIKDPTFSKPTDQLVTNVAGMWPYAPGTSPYKIYPDDQKRVRFITDTPKEEVQKSIDAGSQQLLDTAWKNNLDVKTEAGTPINGLGDLTQFKDNNVVKYLTQNTSVAGRSVENDIQDVSEFYYNLAPGNDAASTFAVSDSRIIDDQQENPQYFSEADPSVAATVINIKQNPDVDYDTGSKPVVTVAIDKQKMLAALNNHPIVGMHLLFNFSKEFYNANGELDASKIPYIVLNYKGFTKDDHPGQFIWGDTDTFGTAEVKDGKLANEKLMNEALGVAKGDWNNSKVLWMGSQILNNFTDVYDVDNYPESYSSSARDMAGLKGDKAAVFFRSQNHLMYGSLLIPHGSFYTNGASNSSFVGGITAANNITLDGHGAPISPDQNNGAFGVFGRKENGDTDFPDLQSPDKKSIIESVDLTAGRTQEVLNNGTANFDIAKDTVNDLPKSGIKANLKINSVAKDLNVYYKLKSDTNWKKLDQQNQTKRSASTTEITINDLESLVTASSSFDRGHQVGKLPVTTKNHMGFLLQRSNIFELAVEPASINTKIRQIEFKPKDIFEFTLNIDGSLEAVVPDKLNMGTEISGQKDEFVQEVLVNEIDASLRNTATQVENATPVINVYNPFKTSFDLSLNRNLIDANQNTNNPLTIKENFLYKMEADDAFMPIINGDEGTISVLHRMQTAPTISDSSDLQSTKMLFKLPYNEKYESGQYQADMSWKLTAID